MKIETQWEVVQDKMSAFGPLIRLRHSHGWGLHSWNVFQVQQGGGRIAPYMEDYVCSVWMKRIKGEPPKEGKLR